uniref:Palmitoyltransferase n=1 Tax=Acrobeloides nanus TaxID=290746 RepID=A0A914E4I3_9BILA
MSWSTNIYEFVRAYRQKNPTCGYILYLCLNSIVLGQLILLVYFCYVYTFELCFGGVIRSNIRIAIYLVVFYGLVFMSIWSLIQVLRTPVSRVPKQYYVDKETDRRLKKVSSFDCIENRYFQECISFVQAKQQREILNEFAERRGLNFAEVFSSKDRQLRYCYSCKLIKPDRCYHCRSCGFCVLRYDHHCPMLNTCISHGNYKFFLLYIGYAFLSTLWSVLTLLEGISVYFVDGFHDSQNWTAHLSRFLLILICVLVQIVVLYYPLAALFFDHILYSVIKDNETTREYKRRPIIHPDSKGEASYNNGAWKNLHDIFGSRLWAFPLNTITTDGLHWEIGYPEYYDGPRLVVLKSPKNQTYIEECIKEIVIKR